MPTNVPTKPNEFVAHATLRTVFYITIKKTGSAFTIGILGGNKTLTVRQESDDDIVEVVRLLEDGLKHEIQHACVLEDDTSTRQFGFGPQPIRRR